MLRIFPLKVIRYYIWKMCVLLQWGTHLCIVPRLQEAYVHFDTFTNTEINIYTKMFT